MERRVAGNTQGCRVKEKFRDGKKKEEKLKRRERKGRKGRERKEKGRGIGRK
jgi:hypothetical protein